MNNLQRFLQGWVAVKISNENQLLKLRRVCEALQIAYINVLQYSLQNMKDILMNEINRDYPLTSTEDLCAEYSPGKGLAYEWEHKAEDSANRGYFDEVVDFDSLELDKIIKNFKNI